MEKNKSFWSLHKRNHMAHHLWLCKMMTMNAIRNQSVIFGATLPDMVESLTEDGRLAATPCTASFSKRSISFSSSSSFCFHANSFSTLARRRHSSCSRAVKYLCIPIQLTFQCLAILFEYTLWLQIIHVSIVRTWPLGQQFLQHQRSVCWT